jgi:cytochrome P450
MTSFLVERISASGCSDISLAALPRLLSPFPVLLSLLAVFYFLASQLSVRALAYYLIWRLNGLSRKGIQLLSNGQSLPAGFKSPAIWQLLRYTHSPLKFLEDGARRFGDSFLVRFSMYGQYIILASPDAVRDVFRGDAHVLHSGESNQFLIPTVGPNSVLVLDEEAHSRQRRIQLPPLKGERMRSFFDAMQTATLESIRTWPVGQPFRILEPMQRITLRVILQAVFGLTAGAERDEIEQKVHRLLAQGRSKYSLILLKTLPRNLLQKSRWAPFYREMRALDESLYSHITACRRKSAEKRGESILADLIEATGEDGRPLSDQEIRDALLTLVLAGHETTSIALAWALEQIVPRVDVVKKITDELNQASGGLPHAEDLSGLEYLDAAIRESLRIRTVLPIVVRLTKRSFMAGGREYPPGIVLCPCSHLVHRRPDLYPDPERFRPERFLERKYAGHEWFPFGGGNRTCLGMAFALYEMKVVLATLFKHVSLAPLPGMQSNPVRRGLSLAPDDGVEMIVKEQRESPAGNLPVRKKDHGPISSLPSGGGACGACVS